MRQLVGLAAVILIIFSCCPFFGAVQEVINQIKESTPSIDMPDPSYPPENPGEIDIPIPEIETEEPIEMIISPCEGIYQKYGHDAALGEIHEDYIGSWHTDPSLSARWNERWVFFSSGNYLFFPSQYECVNSSDPNCTPTPIEDGLWGVQGDKMNFAKAGDMNNIISRSIAPLLPSPIDESPYPYKTTIDGLPFWLYTKDTNYWDPETGEYCD